MDAARIERATEASRCGWPFALVQSSTVVYCSLPLGHDGPMCRLLDEQGHTLAASPRFAVRP